MILRFELMTKMAEEGYRCIETMLELMGNEEMIPARILVEQDETYYLLEKACRQLNILLEKVKHLELMPEVRDDMISRNMDYF